MKYQMSRGFPLTSSLLLDYHVKCTQNTVAEAVEEMLENCNFKFNILLQTTQNVMQQNLHLRIILKMYTQMNHRSDPCLQIHHNLVRIRDGDMCNCHVHSLSYMCDENTFSHLAII